MAKLEPITCRVSLEFDCPSRNWTEEQELLAGWLGFASLIKVFA